MKISFLLTLICSVCLSIATYAAWADIDRTAHWPVEVTLNYNAVYGDVDGIDLEEGDSVGMFDQEGNCYGAGLFDGSRYYLSAFMYEEADPEIPGDISIPGFEEGDTVTFKVYKSAEDREYIIDTRSVSEYLYEYRGRDNPVKIDLVYAGNSGANNATSHSNNTSGSDYMPQTSGMANLSGSPPLTSAEEATNDSAASLRDPAGPGRPQILESDKISGKEEIAQAGSRSSAETERPEALGDSPAQSAEKSARSNALVLGDHRDVPQERKALLTEAAPEKPVIKRASITIFAAKVILMICIFGLLVFAGGRFGLIKI
jgi:hypothetical protein